MKRRGEERRGEDKIEGLGRGTVRGVQCTRLWLMIKS